MQTVGAVESIMTRDIEIRDLQITPRKKVLDEARQLQFDFVPVVCRGSSEIQIMDVTANQILPLTINWLLTPDTSIPTLLERMQHSIYPYFFVQSHGDLVGIVTPADLNKVTARSYFYSELAALEMALAERARAYFGDNSERILELVLRDGKTIAQQKADLRGRVSQTMRWDPMLDYVHLLTLDEMIGLVKQDEGFRIILGFDHQNSVEEAFEGVNQLRRDVMHPVRYMVRRPEHIRRLSDRLGRIQAMVKMLAAI